MKKPIAIMMTAIMILAIAASALPLPACADADDQEGSEGDASSMKVTLKAGEYEITKDTSDLDVIQMEGFSLFVSAGDPMLPHKVYDILLPPDVIWSSLQLKIVSAENRTLDGTYDIKQAAPDVAWVDGRWIEDWGKGKDIVNGRNINVYETNASFPENYLELLPYSQMRKWKFAKVDFYPFQYNPVSKKLTLTESVVIEISYRQSRARIDESLMNDTVMDDIAPQIFTNYEQARGWYEQEPPTEEPQQAHDYVIITTNAIEAGSTKLSSFITHKQSLGHNVLVVTEDDFGGLTGQAPNNKAEKIRQWLINNYAAMGIEYALLVGDPTPYESGEGDIPMKMCWPRRTASTYKESPTDYFYADLTGNWDKDGDLYYGEWSDDYPVSGGVDFTAEVWVGRIPVYGADYTTLDNILQKIIDYETEHTSFEAPGGWRESILMPMGFQSTGYDGAMLAEQMKDDYLDASGITSWRMYQQGNGACGLNSIYTSDEELRGSPNTPNVKDRWSTTDFGVVAWWAHGNPTSTIVGYSGCVDGTLMDSSYTSSLNDDHPAFTYQCSCTNGHPETSNNLQYAILKQGGIATVSATRVSWFNTGVLYGDFDGSTTNSGIGYEYVDRLVQDLPGGDALYLTKQSMSPESDTRLMNWYDFNLYGDPETSLVSAGVLEPDIEVTPTSLEITLAPDTTGQRNLNIANVGDAPLEVYNICDEETGTTSVAVAPNNNPSGNPDEEPVASEPVFLVRKVENAAPDDNQPVSDSPAIKEGRSVPGGDVGDALETATTHAPIWEGLQSLDQAEKQNALIQLEVDSDLDATTMDKVKNIESLWNSGSFVEAIEDLKALEAKGMKFAVGIGWKTPKTVEDLYTWWEGDVRIGTRERILEHQLDFDAQTGNLFAVLRYYDPDSGFYYWAIYISTDDGQTWQETYEWYASYEIRDTSAAVVDDYLFVGYVGGSDGQDARIRRAFVSNGAIDTSYGFVTVFDKGVEIKEIALCTNADDFDNRVYYWAILADNSLVFFWDDQNAVSWTEVSTGVTDAWQGLDATWNEDFPSGYFLWASYIGSASPYPVVVLRTTGTVWEAIEVLSDYTGVYSSTSVTAYNDTVICAYEHDYTNGMGIRYSISYNGGNSWSAGSWTPDPGHGFYRPDVTARGGQGSAIVYNDEAGTFDPVWFRYRDHYSSGPWDAEVVQFNEKDGATAWPNSIEWVPPLSGSTYGYGAIYISWDPDPGTAYFDRTGFCVCVNDAAWMSVSPTSGTVNPGADMDVTVSFDASGLSVGTYEGNIKISSNDPDEGCTVVPVTLTVEDEIPPEAEVYFVPQHSVARYCETTEVEIWVNATNFKSGQINMTYDPSCANVTNYVWNATNFPLSGWSHYEGMDQITFMTLQPTLTGNYHIGTLTIHCVNDSSEGCITPLDFIEVLSRYIEESKLFDPSGAVIPTTWIDGTFECVPGICGDVNRDGEVNMGDVGALHNYVQYGIPIADEWAADVNCDGEINMGDVGALHNHVQYGYPLNCC